MKITKKQLKQIIKEEISKMQESRELGFFDKVGSVLRGQDPTITQTVLDSFYSFYNDTLEPAYEKAKMLRDKADLMPYELGREGSLNYKENKEQAVKTAYRAKEIVDKAIARIRGNYGSAGKHSQNLRKRLGKKELQMLERLSNKLHRMHESILDVIGQLTGNRPPSEY